MAYFTGPSRFGLNPGLLGPRGYSLGAYDPRAAARAARPLQASVPMLPSPAIVDHKPQARGPYFQQPMRLMDRIRYPGIPQMPRVERGGGNGGGRSVGRGGGGGPYGGRGPGSFGH